MGYSDKHSFRASPCVVPEEDSSHSLAFEIVSSSSAAILSKTLDGTVTSWNAAASELFGYNAAEMIGCSLRRLIPADRQREEAGVLADIENGRPVAPYVVTRLGKNRQPIDVSITVSPIRNRSGTIIGASEIIHAVSEARATAPRGQNHNLYERILENASFAMLVLDRDLRQLACNRLWIDYFGPQSAAVGSFLYEVFPRQRPHWMEAHRRGLAGESLRSVAELFELPDGRKLWMRFEVQPWFASESDRIVDGIVIILKDVSEEVQALRESELRLELALGAAQAGTWESVPEQGVLCRNEKLWVMMGQPPETYAPTIEAWLSIMHPEDQATVMPKVQKAVLECGSFEAVWRINVPQGEPERWFFSRGAPVSTTAPLRYFGITVEMTEKKRMEDALHKSEMRLQLALETARAGVWEATPSDGTADWSDSVWRLLGMTPGQSAPSLKTWLSAIHPADRERIMAQIGGSLPVDGAFEAEWRLNRPRGAPERWLLTRGGPVSSAKPYRYVGVTIDITEKKLWETELRETKDRKTFLVSLNTALRDAANPLDAVAIACEMLGKKLACNQAAYAEFGKERKQFIYLRDWNDGTMPQQPPIQKLENFDAVHVLDVLHGRTVVVDDVRLDPCSKKPEVRREYERVGLRAFLYVPMMKDGCLTGILGVHRKVPYAWGKAEVSLAESVAEQVQQAMERARYIRALRESEERLQFALKASNVGCFEIAVKTGKVLASDRTTQSFFNFPLNTPRTLQSVFDCIHPDDLARVRETFERCVNTGEFATIDWRIRLPDGKIRWLTAQGELRIVAGRKVVGGLIQDITARVNGFLQTVDEQTHALQTEKEMAERKADAHAEFLLNMSHELRTPMHAILSFAKFGLKQAGSQDIETLARYFQAIHNSGTRLLGLLNDLLDIAKLESGKVHLDKSDQDFRGIVEHVETELRPLLEERGLTLKTEVLTRNTRATLDRQRIIQVLINLISNSIKFSPMDGKIGVTLLEDRSPAGAEVLRCAVSDEGPGIAEEELESVFEKFIQSSTTKSGAGGTGLGLPICREIVRAHGGHIWAENRKPKGATFSFILPRNGGV